MALAAYALFTLAPTQAQRYRWDWQSALFTAEPWRAFTAAWVHWSTEHGLLNGAALAVLATLGWVARLPPRATLAWIAAWPLTHLSLFATTAPPHYGGLSGTLHAGASVAGVWLAATPGDQPRQAVGWVLLAVLVLKLGRESWIGPTLLGLTSPAIVSVPTAHVSGALAGLLCALAALAFSRRACDA